MRKLRTVHQLIPKVTWIFLGVLSPILSFADKPTEEKKTWPFFKPENIEVPTVNATDRVSNEIDSFIIQKLESKGLTLSPEASKQTLVRRLYFDLIGLPPTPEQVESFINDQNPDAYGKLVDDLLKDLRYGERWARFWLDLARYADTAGYEGDPDMPYAWRYRDYVIDSLNRDKRYDLFIKEQLAGDEFTEIMGAGEIPIASSEKTVAMTFLRLAPFTEPRGDETRHELLSEMTSTTSSVFLGLTVGCAKCHDHKYDQIPTKDFYRMKAFFNTVQIMPPERGDAFQIGGSLPADFYRKGEKEWANQRRQEFESMQEELNKLTSELKSRMSNNVSRSGFGLQAMINGNNYCFDRRGINDGKVHWAMASTDGNHWTFFTDGNKGTSIGSLAGNNSGEWFGILGKNASHISIGEHTAGTGKTKNGGHKGLFAEVLIYDHALTGAERSVVDNYIQTKYIDSSTTQINEPPKQGIRFWIDAGDLDANPQTPNPQNGSKAAEWVDKINGIQLSQNDPNKQPKLVEVNGKKAYGLSFENDFLIGDAKNAKFVKDNQGTIITVLSYDQNSEGYGFEVGGGGKFITTFVNPSADKGKVVLDGWVNNRNNDKITDAERDRYNELKAKVPYIKQHLKRLRPMAMSLRHSFGPPYEPGVPTSRVMIRGEYDNPGEVVEAGFLSCITGNQESAKIRLDPFKRWPTRSRRMALAKWIASADNPLTARVMMNRLWFRHFGRGIVATPSDFGKLSGGPSHQELLDWLAIRFVKENWSLKKMHRIMVNSSTYKQDSRLIDSDTLAKDPNNLLLSRYNRRRLEAEAIRDSVLFISGRLNQEMFGLPIFPPLPGNIADRVKYNNSKWATDPGKEGRKRSIYIYQQRTLSMPFLQTFDALVCEDTIPRRQSSVTPLQALAMYNGNFANEEAAYFAKRIVKEAGDDPTKRIKRAFYIALGRQPSEEEIKELLPYAANEEKLVGLSRILYNTTEFAYVD